MLTPFVMDRPFYVLETDPPAKRAILERGLDLFASRGVDGVTVRDIADAAGFSNPALFKHFPTKDDLVRHLFEVCYRELGAAFRPPPEAARPLRAAFDQALELIERAPECVHFVLENLRRGFPGLPEPLRREAIPGRVRRLIAAEQAAGRLRASLDPDLAAALVLGLLGQIARMAHFRELAAPPRRLSDPLWSLLIGGLGV